VGRRDGGSFQWTQFPEGGRDAYICVHIHIVTKTLRSNLGWPMGVRIPVRTALMFSPLLSLSPLTLFYLGYTAILNSMWETVFPGCGPHSWVQYLINTTVRLRDPIQNLRLDITYRA
jgi:hypothetical protein